MVAALQINNLGKRYIVNHQRQGVRYQTLRDSLADLAALPLRKLRGEKSVISEQFWALRNINFEVQPGQVVGIVGRNGAGKSTLLKVLSRITKPTEGRVALNGRVGSLLEVGTGFHQELTGRENVYLNGSILGMSKREIDGKFDEIVDFAEVEQFLDTPVKRYSSGMYVRLAFAVAAHLEPEILIVDEVLAVGDAAFQKKCLGKMAEVRSHGRSILFVSHNMMAVKTLCDTCAVLEHGKLICFDDVNPALAAYANATGPTQQAAWTRPADLPLRPLSIMSVDCRVSGQQPRLLLECEAVVTSTAEHAPAFCSLDIVDNTGTPIMQCQPKAQGFIYSKSAGGMDQSYRLKLTVELPPLIPGDYGISTWVGTNHSATLEMIDRQCWFHIAESPVPGRTFPYGVDHGFVFPVSNVAIGKL